MATYNVRLFKNTGFNLENIPDTASLLNDVSINKVDVDAVWVYQNQELGKIRIKTDFTNIYSVDYCRIGTAGNNQTYTYYFVTNITMINPVTAELDLQIDAITTIGLTNITNNILDGWCTRRCVTDDTLFLNNIEEDFTPALELSLVYQPMVDNTLSMTVVASTVDLDKISDTSDYLKARTFLDDVTGNYVAVPTLPMIDEGTQVTIKPSPNSKEYTKTLPNIRLFALRYNWERYLKALSILWSLGAFDSITGMYRIVDPTNLTHNPDDDLGASGSLTSIEVKNTTEVSIITGTPVLYTVAGYSIKNNKIFGPQFNKVTVASYVSGDSLDYDIDRIVLKDQGVPDDKFKFYAWNDPSPGGKTYIRPAYYSGIGIENNGVFSQVVCGGNWPNTQTVLQNAPGWAINQKIYAEQHTQELLGGAFNLLDSANSIRRLFTDSLTPSGTARTWGTSNTIASAEDVANRQFINFGTVKTSEFSPNISGVTGLLGNANYGLNNSIQKNINNLGFQARNGLVSPTIKFPVDNSMLELVGNGFYMIRTMLSPSDTKRFDKYLTMYGYRVSEPLTKDCFYGRQYFNYIECVNLSIGKLNVGTETGNTQECPLRLKQIAVNQLQNGIRIWHTQVTQDAFNNNPIVGG